MRGRIIQSLSGFYDVQVDNDEIIRTKPRGLFRKDNNKPLVGDWVDVEVGETGEATLTKIAPRKNELIRPLVANVDIALIVVSVKHPDFSSILLDRFLVYLEMQNIQGVIIFTKEDLLSEDEQSRMKEYKKHYQSIGYEVISNQPNELSDLFKRYTQKIFILMGQTGAGKSTLLNRLIPELELETQEISKSLNRGKHTTRAVKLYPYEKVLIADTPGFSAIQLPFMDVMDLANAFIEWEDVRTQCRFKPCSHTHEPHCGVKEFVEENEFLKERYNHYLNFLEELKNQKPHYERK
ncbi:ribosome small subunit-dependent GTPase A [Atopobacter phocae]|uniref:ribosome small subunit-dependent GTPase A n=1 Tax=Atopobacter phocae TaxID=136492 RepID=UPI00046F8D4D|nr:ribosome small subunit-dependent GTPase A [Atopobacter phocae]